MAAEAKVIIVGAGIGGLVAALALRQRGFQVEVHEQAPQLKEIGAGLQLAANSTRVLHDLGLARHLAAIAWEPQGKTIRLWNTGKTWPLFDLAMESVERYGAPYYMVHRADLHTMLIDALHRADPSALKLDSAITDVAEKDGRVVLHGAEGEVASGDIVIGADGVHSTIRRQLFGTETSEYTGLLAWRGVIPVEKLPARLLAPVGTNWVGPHRHVIQYMMRGGELMNFVGVVERDDWTAESWTAQGTHAECHADFEGWHQDIHTMIENVEVLYKWALVGRQPMDRWSRGRVTLLGDACHPTLPFLAQGAGMAIEDGLILARCLERFYPDHATALQRYEDLRHERTARVVRGSIENGRRFHNPELESLEGAERYVDREWEESRVRERYDWLFKYNAGELDIMSAEDYIVSDD